MVDKDLLATFRKLTDDFAGNFQIKRDRETWMIDTGLDMERDASC